MMCHPIDQSHERAQRLCCEPCKRFPPDCNLHPCPKLCKDTCEACCALVGPVLLKRGHIANTAKCHLVDSPVALEKFSLLCQQAVDHMFEPCGHKAKTNCANTKTAVPRCPAKCGKPMKCGHPCKKMYVSILCISFPAYRILTLLDCAMETTNARTAVNGFCSVGTYALVCAISQRNAVRVKRNVLRDVLIHDVPKKAAPR